MQLAKLNRIVIAGLAGDVGKSLVSLGAIGALRARGLSVAPFKKGPDYIDAGWLAFAAGRPGRNLDTFLMSEGAVGAALVRGGAADLALIEGNRGLHDGTGLSAHDGSEMTIERPGFAGSLAAEIRVLAGVAVEVGDGLA